MGNGTPCITLVLMYLLIGAVLVVGPGQVRLLHPAPVRLHQEVRHQLRIPVIVITN